VSWLTQKRIMVSSGWMGPADDRQEWPDDVTGEASMADRITLDLPTGVLQRAELLALRAGRPVGDYLAETLQHALEPFGDLSETNPQDWSDQEALEAADSRMPEADDRRLSELLQRQKGGLLQPKEQGELTALMGLYQRGLLRKSQGLREAVRRGLRPPVQS
jgi:hypothetical protein